CAAGCAERGGGFRRRARAAEGAGKAAPMPAGARCAQRTAARREQIVRGRGQGFPPGARDFGDLGPCRAYRALAESARSVERTRASRRGRIDAAQPWRDRGRNAAARDGARRIQIDGGRMTVEAVASTNYGTTASGSSFYAAMRILPRAQ